MLRTEHLDEEVDGVAAEVAPGPAPVPATRISFTRFKISQPSPAFLMGKSSVWTAKDDPASRIFKTTAQPLLYAFDLR